MDLGLLILRAVVGLTLAAHGAQKLFGWFGGSGLSGAGEMMERLGFVPGRRNALLAGLGEAGGGLLLALGLFTPAASAVVIGVMTVAAASVWKKGFFAGKGGFELPMLVGVPALAVAFTGPGRLSLDALLGWQVSGWRWGVGALALGLVGGAGRFLTRTRPAASPAKMNTGGAQQA